MINDDDILYYNGTWDYLHIVQQLSTSVINYTLSLIQLSGRQKELWQGKQNEIKVFVTSFIDIARTDNKM